MIQPKIDYGISVWGYCSDANRRLIVRLQHRAARIITGNMDYVNTRGENLVKELGWQSIENRRDYFTAVLMYRCINEIAPRRLIDGLVMTSETHELHTRSTANKTVQVPEPKCELFRNSFRYQGALLWNRLPSYLQNASDIHSFKRLYKMHYFK